MDVNQFPCRCGQCQPMPLPEALKNVIDLLEGYFGPATCTSGHRCAEHNKRVGGATASQHVQGRAADLVFPGTSPRAVYDWLDHYFPHEMGIGLYNTHVHIDTRPDRARWNYAKT